MASSAQRSGRAGDFLRDALPKIVLSPSLAMVLIFVYGFIVFGMHASMKRSFMMTVRRLAGTR